MAAAESPSFVGDLSGFQVIFIGPEQFAQKPEIDLGGGKAQGLASGEHDISSRYHLGIYIHHLGIF